MAVSNPEPSGKAQSEKRAKYTKKNLDSRGSPRSKSALLTTACRLALSKKKSHWAGTGKA
jgi:hypothetical protein